MIGDRIVLTDKTRFYLDGKEVTEKKYRERHPEPSNEHGIPGGTPTRGWPLHSVALKVHAKRRDEAEADAKAKGVDTAFDRSGCPVFTSEGHMRKYMKAYGYHRNNSFV